MTDCYVVITVKKKRIGEYGYYECLSNSVYETMDDAIKARDKIFEENKYYVAVEKVLFYKTK